MNDFTLTLWTCKVKQYPKMGCDIIIIVLCLLNSFGATPNNNEVFKSHGVLVKDAGDIRHISAVWNIITVINYPTKPDLTRTIKLLQQYVVNNTKTGKIALEDAAVFIPRIEKLTYWDRSSGTTEGFLPNDYVYTTIDRIRYKREIGKRSKRGLINAGGNLAKFLFGTATVEQFDILKEAVDHVREQGMVLYTNEKNLLQVFNRSLQTVIENRYNDLKLLSDIRASQRVIKEGLIDLGGEIEKQNLARRIDMHIAQIENCINEFDRLIHIFHIQRTELEHGWISPQILPDHVLGRTVRTMTQLGFQTLSLEWYYKNLHVLPLWYSHGQLAFQISIPAVSMENYKYYQLSYFYVPWGREHLRKFQGNSYVALDTRTGNSFYADPADCVGMQPYVCRPSHINLRPTCEVWLITRTNPKPTCYFEITERKNRTLEIEHHDFESDEIVLVAYEPFTITKRCEKQTPFSFVVDGPQILHLNMSCSLETVNWRVHGLARFSSNYSLSYRQYENIVPLNLSLPTLPPLTVRNKLAFLPGEAHNFSIDSLLNTMAPDEILTNPQFLGYNQDFMKKTYGEVWYLKYVLISLVALFSLPLISAGFYFFIVKVKCGKSSRAVQRPRSPVIEESIYSYVDDDFRPSLPPGSGAESTAAAEAIPLTREVGPERLDKLVLYKDNSYKTDSYLATRPGSYMGMDGYLPPQPKHIYATIFPDKSKQDESAV